MPGRCPLCPCELVPVRAGEVEVRTCPKCAGLWFEAGTLELFPDRPSTRSFVAASDRAPYRCNGGEHPVDRTLARCPICGGVPARCPRCSGALARIPTPVCAVDACSSCGGVWLDAGEFELLEKVRLPLPAGAMRGWEVPAAFRMGAANPKRDPWTAPGQTEPVTGATGSVAQPLTCRHCGVRMSAQQAWAFGGDTYCGSCRPPEAVSGADANADSAWWYDVLDPLLRLWSRVAK